MAGKAAAAFLLVLAGAALHAAGDSYAPQAGAGIAARYPMDAGIEADPKVVFAEGFESDTWRDRWYRDNVRWRLSSVDRAQGEGRAFTGAASCRLTVPAGKTYGSTLGSGKLKPGWKTMHMRFYVWCSPNYRGGKLATTTALDQQIWVPGHSGKRPTGTDKANAMVCVKPDGSLTMYYYNLDQRGVWGSGGKPNIGTPPKLTNGEWHCIEIQGTMNDPGQKNSLQRLWFDGRLVGEWTGFRWRFDESLKWNSWCFLIGANQNAPEEQHVLIDNIVVATDYIGPMAKQSQGPAAAVARKVPPVVAPDDAKRAQEEKEAGRLFQMARQAEQMGQDSVAKRLYAQIVEKYPETEVAKKAKARSR